MLQPPCQYLALPRAASKTPFTTIQPGQQVDEHFTAIYSTI
jgi:hypothetical protein